MDAALGPQLPHVQPNVGVQSGRGIHTSSKYYVQH